MRRDYAALAAALEAGRAQALSLPHLKAELVDLDQRFPQQGSKPMPQFYIYSGNYAEYRAYLRDNRLNRSEAVYLSSAERLCGLHLAPEQLVFFGTWYTRRDRVQAEYYRDHFAEEFQRRSHQHIQNEWPAGDLSDLGKRALSLCPVCFHSDAGIATRFPEQYPQAELLQHQCFLTNALLDQMGAFARETQRTEEEQNREP